MVVQQPRHQTGCPARRHRNQRAYSPIRSPPDILITTPETLQAILSGWVLRQHLQSLNWIVIDEVHELADSKRGSQLSLALERIRDLIGKDFQMIGLSATIGSPDKVAQFLVGDKRPVEIIRVPVAKMVQLQVIYPKPTEEDSVCFQALHSSRSSSEIADHSRLHDQMQIRAPVHKHTLHFRSFGFPL